MTSSNNTYIQKGCRYILSPLLVITIILMMSCFASATFDLEAEDQWSSLGSNEWNWGRQTGVKGDFEEAISPIITQGAAFPPILVNVKNSTDENELVGSDGSSIKVWKANQTSILILDEFVATTTQTFPYEAVEDANDLIHIIAVHGDNLYDMTYNASDSFVNKTMNLTNRTAYPASYIKCTSERAAFGVCYWIDTDNDLVTYSLSTQNISQTAITKASSGTPTAIGDVDNDGVLELVFLGTVAGEVHILDTNTEAIQKTITVASVGGSATSLSCVDIAIADLDGGNMEVLVSCGASASGGPPLPYSAGIIAYNLDGTINSLGPTESVTGGNKNHPSKILIGDFYSANSEYEVCMVIDHINGDKLVCDAMPSSTEIIDYSVSTSFGEDINRFKFSAGDLNDDGYGDILVTNKIYDINSGTNKTLTINTGGFQITGDVNDDDVVEIISMDTSSTYVAFSNFTNSPPVINTNATYKVNFKPQIICNGTSLTFGMKECGAQICQYTNDVDTDTERIISKCDGSGYQNGTLSPANPSLSCLFDELGTFSYGVYLQDNSNPTDLGQVRNYVTRVVLGTPGVDCNLAPTDSEAQGIITPPTVVEDGDEYTSEAEIDYVVSTLTGQSQFMNNIMVLIFTIMVFLGLAKLGHVSDFRIYAIAIFSLWTSFALLKILPWVYVVILAIVFIAIGALSFAKQGEST